MDFSDVPTLKKFEQHATRNPECPITQEAYQAVQEIIATVNTPVHSGVPLPQAEDITNLADRCKAVERSTRIIWACAAATDHVDPPLWEYIPDYHSAVNYFENLPDLDLMAQTKEHRITWEKNILQGGA